MQYHVGIVLSGGGSRGIAHVGVLRALAEHGITPEVVSGTSAGALVGALYAAGHSWEEMLEFFLRKSPFRLSKVTFGGRACSTPRRSSPTSPITFRPTPSKRSPGRCS